MTAILLCCVALLLLVAALYLVLCHEPLVAAWWYRLFRDPEPYDSSFAASPDPVDAHAEEYQRSSYFIDGGHPKDCSEKCCWEIRLTEMHDAFDWGAYEYEMRGIR